MGAFKLKIGGPKADSLCEEKFDPVRNDSGYKAPDKLVGLVPCENIAFAAKLAP